MFYRIIFCFMDLLIVLVGFPVRDVFAQKGISTIAYGAGAVPGRLPSTGKAELRIVRSAEFRSVIVSHRHLRATNLFQRCAGSVDYLIRDDKGEIISASQITVTVLPVEGYQNWGYGRHPYRSTRAFDSKSSSPGSNPRRELVSEPESLVFGTGCNRPLISVKLESRKVTMVLQFKNIPSELNFYIDSLPFQEGEFEIDLKPVFERAFSEPRFPIREMSDEEKDKDMHLKELKEATVISSREWKKAR